MNYSRNILMGIMELFRPKADILREKIIFTQKSRIETLEKEMEDLKKNLSIKDGEISEARTNFDRSKERLVDQIIELSDKFATISTEMRDLAFDNAKMKSQIEYKKKK